MLVLVVCLFVAFNLRVTWQEVDDIEIIEECDDVLIEDEFDDDDDIF